MVIFLQNGEHCPCWVYNLDCPQGNLSHQIRPNALWYIENDPCDIRGLIWQLDILLP